MTAVIHTERLTKTYGAHRGITDLDQPMAGQYDLVGVVAASVLAIGGLAIGAWGLQRRDVGR